MISYPRLKPEQMRGNRFDKQKIKQIKEMFEDGYSINKIAKKLGSNYITVRSHIDPEYRKKINHHQKKYNLKKYHTNPEFKKRLNEMRRKNLQIQRNTIPELKDYNRKKVKECRKKAFLIVSPIKD